MLRVKKEKEVKSIMEKEKINNTKDLYVGIGGNLNNPIEQVKKAIHAISKLDKFNNIKTSNFYESAPMGPSNQDNYTLALYSTSDLNALRPKGLSNSSPRVGAPN